MSSLEELPVPVLDHPRWRVNYRPATYEGNRLPTLADCFEVVQRCNVYLRGWDFPHIPPGDSKRAVGAQWVAAWSDFDGHFEYWRFYQSTQFLYLGSVREVTDPRWSAEVRDLMIWHSHGDADISSVPGFVHVTNLIYNITEMFEFAARLAQAGVYTEPLTINVSLVGIRGFMLVAENSRSWRANFLATENELAYEITLSPYELISSAAESAVTCIVWMFERFRWLKPNLEMIRSDQQKLLTRKF